jgi:hypothetical protein
MAHHKLDIFKMLKAIDCKDYSFYDNLSDDEKKGFSAFLGLKWASSVVGDNPLQHYYIVSTNHYANINLFDINKHPKLQWLSLASSSPNVGIKRHEWLGTKKKPNGKSKVKDDIKRRLMAIHPTYKEDEIELLSSMVTKKDLKHYDSNCGNK